MTLLLLLLLMMIMMLEMGDGAGSGRDAKNDSNDDDFHTKQTPMKFVKLIPNTPCVTTTSMITTTIHNSTVLCC